MKPYRVAGVQQFVTTYGPLSLCKASGHALDLWPHEADLPSAITKLLAQSNSFTNILVNDAEVHRGPLAPIAALALPKSTGGSWLATQKPQFATVVGMLQCLRRLSIHSSRVMASWSDPTNEAAELLVPGFSRQLTDLLPRLVSSATLLLSIPCLPAPGVWQSSPLAAVQDSAVLTESSHFR